MAEGLYKGLHNVFQKRGVFYYQRRVPVDLRNHYKSDKIVFSLRTKSERAAVTRALSISGKLEEEWLVLRWQNGNDLLDRFRRQQLTSSRLSDAPKLSEAKAIYLKAKGINRPKTFFQEVRRAIGGIIDLHGDRPIDQYTRAEANLYRDSLFARELKPISVRKLIGVVRAVINFTTRELGLSDVQAFSGIYLGNDEMEKAKRKPIPLDVIRAIQRECRQIDDENRHLIALVSDTGMRLGEAVGLVKSDLNLDHEHPHLMLQAHPWRRLKTPGSRRIVPLVGDALWAAQRAYKEANGEFLFPRYASKDGCNANSASAALNKWIKPRVPDGCVIHSFRHSFRDRLRAVECPREIIDRLGGWAIEGVGEAYGEGYNLSVLGGWVVRLS